MPVSHRVVIVHSPSVEEQLRRVDTNLPANLRGQSPIIGCEVMQTGHDGAFNYPLLVSPASLFCMIAFREV